MGYALFILFISAYFSVNLIHCVENAYALAISFYIIPSIKFVDVCKISIRFLFLDANIYYPAVWYFKQYSENWTKRSINDWILYDSEQYNMKIKMCDRMMIMCR